MKKSYLIIAVLSVFVISACGKKSETTTQKDAKGTEQTDQKSIDQQKKEDSMKAITEQINKEKKIKEALEEEKIINNTLGEWAISADASSSYMDHTGKDSWSADQMIGKPDVETYGDNRNAWTSKEADKGLEWVKLTFQKAVNATEVNIRQTYNPGAIIKVELIDEKGKSHIVWEDVDKTKYEPDKIQYFTAIFNRTDYKTKTVKITLAANAVQGWNEIDAVQLVGN